jgi:hypothetical protein
MSRTLPILAILASLVVVLWTPITLLICSQRTAIAILMIGGRFGVVAMMLFSLMYWRCPRCKEYFPKGSDGHYYENCNTKFDA